MLGCGGVVVSGGWVDWGGRRDKGYAQGGVDAADADDELEDGAAMILGFFGRVGD